MSPLGLVAITLMVLRPSCSVMVVENIPNWSTGIPMPFTATVAYDAVLPHSWIVGAVAVLSCSSGWVIVTKISSKGSSWVRVKVFPVLSPSGLMAINVQEVYARGQWNGQSKASIPIDGHRSAPHTN